MSKQGGGRGRHVRHVVAGQAHHRRRVGPDRDGKTEANAAEDSQSERQHMAPEQAPLVQGQPDEHEVEVADDAKLAPKRARSTRHAATAKAKGTATPPGSDGEGECRRCLGTGAVKAGLFACNNHDRQRNTDGYQPIERERKITRGVLEVLDRFSHPVAIVTKSTLVLRDIDILASLASRGLTRVAISVTTLDHRLARKMEPRASTPESASKQSGSFHRLASPLP